MHNKEFHRIKTPGGKRKRPSAKRRHQMGVAAARINGAWGQTIEGFVAAGAFLIEIKEALPHGMFGYMFRPPEPMVNFGISTAEKLMTIARHPIISKSEFFPNLPHSWGLLHRLAVLAIDEKRFKQLMAEKRINSEMRGKDVSKLEEELRSEGVFIYNDLFKFLNLTLKFARKFPDPKPLAEYMVYKAKEQVDEHELRQLPKWITALYRAIELVRAEAG